MGRFRCRIRIWGWSRIWVWGWIRVWSRIWVWGWIRCLCHIGNTDPAQDRIVTGCFFHSQGHNCFLWQLNSSLCISLAGFYCVKITQFGLRAAIYGIVYIHLTAHAPPAGASQHDLMLTCRKCYLICDVLAATGPPATCIRIGRADLAVTLHISGVTHNTCVTPAVLLCLCLICCLCIQQFIADRFYIFPCLGTDVVAVDHVFHIFRDQLYLCSCRYDASLHGTGYSYIAVWITGKGNTFQVPCNCFFCTIYGHSFRKLRLLSHDGGRCHGLRGTVSCHDLLIFFRGHTDRCTMSCAARHLVCTTLRFCEYTALQIGCYQRVISAAAKIIHQQTPFVCSVGVILIQLKNGRPLYILIAVQGIGSNLCKVAKYAITLLQEDGLCLCAKAVCAVAFIFCKTIIRSIMFDHRRINTGLIFFNVQFRFCKCIEISGFYIVQTLFRIYTRCSGCPVYHIFASLLIIGCFRRPGAACTDGCGYFHHTFIGPVYKICRFPDHQALTSVVLRCIPSVSTVDLQVCRDQIEFVAFRRTNDKRITHTFFTQCGCKNRMVIVQIIPVHTILAGCKIDLLAVRITFSCKICKEVIGVLSIFDLFRCCFYGKRKIFGRAESFPCDRSGQCHIGIFLRSGHSPRRHCIIAFYLMRSDIHDITLFCGPGHFCCPDGLRQCNIAIYLRTTLRGVW